MIRWLAWRLHRRGLVGFTVGGFLLAFNYGLAYRQAAGTTAADQAAFGRAVLLAAKEFTFLVPIPVHPETLGGYEQYKWLAGATILFAVWAGIAGVGAGRGDEDRGFTAEWIAAGLSRSRILVRRSAAYALVLLAACLASTLGISAVAPIVGQDANVAGEIGKAVAMFCGLFAMYALVLLISQLPPERQTGTAAGIGTLLVLLVVNGIADSVPSASALGAISPFHWMEQTTSAAPGGTFALGPTLLLAAAGTALLAAAVVVFVRRDVGSGLLARGRATASASRAPSGNPLLRFPFTEGLWEQKVGLGFWALGTLLLGAVMIGVDKAVVDALLSDPSIAAMFRIASSESPYAYMLGLLWFGFVLLILAGYSVVQASRWAGQDAEGRVEMLLSTPVSRTRVVIDRALEFALASLAIVVAGYIGIASRAPASGIVLDAGRVFVASALLWPFALAFGGLAVAVAGRWPRIAVPFLAAFAVVEYFTGDLAPLLGAPGWVADLSVFHLYGNPVSGPAPWGAAFAMTAVFAGGFAAAILLIRRRDVSTA